jgi:hypothetical protein
MENKRLLVNRSTVVSCPTGSSVKCGDVIESIHRPAENLPHMDLSWLSSGQFRTENSVPDHESSNDTIVHEEKGLSQRVLRY